MCYQSARVMTVESEAICTFISIGRNKNFVRLLTIIEIISQRSHILSLQFSSDFSQNDLLRFVWVIWVVQNKCAAKAIAVLRSYKYTSAVQDGTCKRNTHNNASDTSTFPFD
jgi:hypothetical protein